MIHLVPIQKMYQDRFKRQEKIEKLELTKDGLCAHVGKISPGCFWCLSPTALSYGVLVGIDAGLPDVCNLRCSYCFKRDPTEIQSRLPLNFSHFSLSTHLKERIRNQLLSAKRKAENHEFTSFSFSGDGAEPLLYMPVIKAYMDFYKSELEPLLKIKAWYKLYTNGLLANKSIIDELHDLGITEIRFHIGASNFSAKVIENIRYATGVIPTITVETPAWPPHREKLMESLSLFNDIGIKHLNLIEVAVTQWNIDEIAKRHPDCEIYHSYLGLALDDKGLVYDIMNEVITNKFNYSVLDCNTFIRKVRDQTSYDHYFREALRKISYGKDWGDTGNYPI